MCMKERYMSFTAVVQGRTNPKLKINVFLQAGVAESEQLWEEGILAYDISLKQNF